MVTNGAPREKSQQKSYWRKVLLTLDQVVRSYALYVLRQRRAVRTTLSPIFKLRSFLVKTFLVAPSNQMVWYLRRHLENVETNPADGVDVRVVDLRQKRDWKKAGRKLSHSGRSEWKGFGKVPGSNPVRSIRKIPQRITPQRYSNGASLIDLKSNLILVFVVLARH